MNPQEMYPYLSGLLGEELADLLVKIAIRHKTSAAWTARIPSHVLVRLMEVACGADEPA